MGVKPWKLVFMKILENIPRTLLSKQFQKEIISVKICGVNYLVKSDASNIYINMHVYIIINKELSK